MTKKSSHRTAWSRSGHPAEQEACPQCGAQPGAPCVLTQSPFGPLSSAIGRPILGLHKERVDFARDVRGES